MINLPTAFDTVYEAFFRKIERDADFFNYYNLTTEEALEFAKDRAGGYLKESITKLALNCSSEVNFNDYSEGEKIFNFELTGTEIKILGSLMFEFYLEKDIAKLKVFSEHLTSQDLQRIHSPANERKTYVEMFSKVQSDNDRMIKAYAARDRLSGILKKIKHATYFEEAT